MFIRYLFPTYLIFPVCIAGVVVGVDGENRAQAINALASVC